MDGSPHEKRVAADDGVVGVLLVDDSPLVRQALRTLLELVPHVQVIGEAADGVEALSVASRERPRAVLLDLEMPGMDGFTAAAGLRRLLPGCRLVALTVHDGDTHRRRALEAGFDAYLVKGGPLEALTDAVTSRAAGVRRPVPPGPEEPHRRA